MPRTTEQILDQMASVQAGISELSGLTSTSQVSFFGNLKTMFALFTQSVEATSEGAISDLNSALASQQVGSLAWYVRTIKAFQLGDTVGVYSGQVGYAVIDTAKQIIKQVSVTEDPSGRLLIKVAKQLQDITLQPLTTDELAAVKDYVRSVKYAGVAADVVSLPADIIKLYATVEYDRQVLNAGGFLLANLARNPVIEYVNNYISTLPFDATFSWTALSTYMKAACPGVIDFQITQSLIKPSGATDYTPFTREVTSRAGYMSRDAYSEYTYV